MGGPVHSEAWSWYVCGSDLFSLPTLSDCWTGVSGDTAFAGLLICFDRYFSSGWPLPALPCGLPIVQLWRLPFISKYSPVEVSVMNNYYAFEWMFSIKVLSLLPYMFAPSTKMFLDLPTSLYTRLQFCEIDFTSIGFNFCFSYFFACVYYFRYRGII